MSVHDLSNKSGHDAPKSGFEQYFFDISVDCPYGLEKTAVYHQAQLSSVPDDTMHLFLQNGYRRNGNYIYTMKCPDCKACVPIRMHAKDFLPNRNQKRVLEKNRDVSVGVAPIAVTKENLDLLERFLASRFPEAKSSALSYYSGFFLGSITRSFEIRYRIGEQLIGIAIVDASTDWLNAVYFYFDPEVSQRSPGTFNILSLITFCQHHNIEFLYLGYWIDGVPSMSYKSHYKPHELLLERKWKPVNRN